MLVWPLQSISVVRQFLQQLVTADRLLFLVVEEGMPLVLMFCVFWYKKKKTHIHV